MAVARLSPLEVFLRLEKTGRVLIGDTDGANVTFLTPEKFISGTLKVFRNGARLREGVSDDYTIAESGGPGSGLDSVIFNPAAPPKAGDNLVADYVANL
jgi:hypothetical protein